MHDDLGAGLTRIKFITENMIEHNTDPSLKIDVQKLKSSSNELVEKMGEIIWAMNEKNNSLEDLLFYLRSYAVDYCSENKLSCDFIIPESIPSIIIDGQTRRNIFLVLKESLHNIVKHASAENVTVQVVMGKTLILTISDDGKGFVDSPNTNGNGLLSMRQRAAGLNGKLFVHHDGPFTVQLEIPLA
jgi:signal transduction histidine kinase